jgi:asparagine synthase (glutamine-hydrolysing)
MASVPLFLAAGLKIDRILYRDQENIMCGISGIVNFDRARSVDPDLLERMTTAMVHRGPDDDGYFVGDNAGFGHRRLSIIDLGGGKQPIFNEDESVLIVFNGEIYNYADLTSELTRLGHRFKSRSDTEAIVHAYEQYGDACVDHLRGMFAFAIWDRRRKRLLVARDRLGIKPLYFHLCAGFLAFASEIKSLLQIPSVSRVVDPAALESYLTLRYVPGPQTMFKGISKLQPGHLLVMDGQGVHIHKYWDVKYEAGDGVAAADYLGRFNELLEESVKLRLVAEVPLGVFLSGGLDSSDILAVTSKLRERERIKTFSVGYEVPKAEEESVNEFAYARLAAEAFGAEHHEFKLTAESFRDSLNDLVWYLDEPLADDSCIPLFFIARLARKHITVVLSGEGADEILGGYGIYRRMLAIESAYERFPRLAPWVASKVASVFTGQTVQRYARWASVPMEQRYRGVSMGMAAALREQLLGRQGEGGAGRAFRSCLQAVPKKDALNRMLYADAKIWLPDDLLLKADKMTMANSLELRVPFLDHKLVEFAATLPVELKLKGSTGKYLLREAMKNVLPEAVLHRPKKGFPVPTESWLRGDLRDFVHDTLLSRDAACRDYMDSGVIEKIVTEHEQRRKNRRQEIWTLLIFEIWHRLFIDRQTSAFAKRGPLYDRRPQHHLFQ